MSRYFCVMSRLCAAEGVVKRSVSERAAKKSALWLGAATVMVFFLAGQSALADYAIVKTIGSQGIGDGQFEEPTGIAVDSSDNVFVSDTINDRIQEFDSSGALVRIIGTSGTGNGQLKLPGGLAIDAAGNLWVADFGNHRIQEFTANGSFVQHFGGTPQMQSPVDLDFDSSGNVWIADQTNLILQYTSSGTFIKQIGSVSSIATPFSIAIDTSDNLWVANRTGSRDGTSVAELSNTGTVLPGIGKGGGAFFPEYPVVSVDHDGNIWIGDPASRLKEFDPNRSFLQIVRGIGQFDGPGGIDFDSQGNIWVTDFLTNHVFEFAPVPEPASALLAMVAVGAIFAVRERFKRRKIYGL